MQFYDADQLVRDVQIHLQLQGLEAEIQPGQAKDAGIAAGMLLRSLGITPAMDGRDALIRAIEKPWADSD